MKKERFYLIDLFKLLGAICIVMIHTIATGGREGILYDFLGKVIYGLPVPFFFVCSGFLFGNKILKKDSDLKEITKKYLKRLLIPLVFWCLISSFFVFDFRSNYQNISFWMTFFQRFLFSPWCAMWYVMGLIVAIGIMYWFIKKDKVKYLVYLVPLLYVFALLCGNYYFIIQNTFIANIINEYETIFLTSRNGLFYGLPFVTTGYLIALKRRQTPKINYNKYLIIAIVSFITLVIEVMILKKQVFLEESTLYISSLILIPSFVFYLTKFNNSQVDLSLMGKYSVGIYFVHQFINYVYKNTLGFVGIKLFIVVLSTSLLLLFILYKINNKYINKVIS